MNLKTITFDADKWQLMPKEPTPEILSALDAYLAGADEYLAALAAAPQPEPTANCINTMRKVVTKIEAEKAK